MATFQQPVPGVSSRRSACDKCRLSKARCLRKDHNQDRCDRCVRARSECTTSPVFKLRNWQLPNDLHNSFQHKKVVKKRPRHGNQQHRPSITNEASLDQELNLSESTKEQSIPHDDDVDRDCGGPKPVLSSIASDSQCEQALCLFQETPMDFFENLADIHLPSEEAFSEVPLLSRFNPTPTSQSPFLPFLDQQDTFETAPQLSSICSSSRTFVEEPLENNDIAAEKITQTALQQIAKLDYTVVTLLERLDVELPKGKNGTAFLPGEDVSLPLIVEDTVAKTIEYLEILKQLTDSVVSTSCASRSTTSDPRNMRWSSYSRSPPDHNLDENYDSDELNSCGEISGSASTVPKVPDPDTASLLRVLLVYVHLLRLQVGLFAKSGSLQALILIETVTNLFEKIDVLLGLPEEFKMNKYRAQQQGLLNVPHFSDVAWSILRRVDKEGGDDGKGGIKSLRKHMVKVKRLLRERFAP
ncbi:hypothetical protein P154DRAFT_583058 [Amniculicola lignicola CBS 123094]|uniref:Zn(2)-C6 fungal-type domain-containing protein n=1 Tax=Amniculicola lignicola CBS 123094 TaxID=1392246 RepID=A0A6A5W260_9PLEO|nr:hypothetical protein P154DRAFT_583058 [Amniculicola lignicola CBS 123094]